MTSFRAFHSTRVCPEVPGGESDMSRLFGRLLMILTEPNALEAVMKIFGPAGASVQPGNKKTRLCCAHYTRCLEAGHPPETVSNDAMTAIGMTT